MCSIDPGTLSLSHLMQSLRKRMRFWGEVHDAGKDLVADSIADGGGDVDAAGAQVVAVQMHLEGTRGRGGFDHGGGNR